MAWFSAAIALANYYIRQSQTGLDRKGEAAYLPGYERLAISIYRLHL